jgi:sialate O-acetylesterase
MKYFLFLICCIPFYLQAKIILPDLVSNHMVLQRNTEVKLWGWAEANEKITIRLSWNKKPISINADKDGNWEVKIKTTLEVSPQTIQLKSKDSNILIEDVLFGEVWLCSGQSNMEMPLKGYIGEPVFGGYEAILKANNKNLRLFQVVKVGTKKPLKNFAEKSKWEISSPEVAATFSAIGFFYGNQLQETLQVPVGVIHASWGGSPVQAWMSEETLQALEPIDWQKHDFIEKLNQTPTALFNAMIHPIINYHIKGALWYQGENNRGKFISYKTLLPNMVKEWRAKWNVGDFPFYFVQIAPFHYQKLEAFDAPANSAYMREAMVECVALIPNSGIAITTDLGSDKTIHPPKKIEIAHRLILIALNQCYGMKNIAFKGPELKDFSIQENTIELFFNEPNNGLYSNGDLTAFEIAGEDRVFYPAIAIIHQKKSIKVSCNKVAKPVAVRYAWSNFVDGNLYNGNLLPASSFRTDQWEKATRANQN